MEKSKPKKHYWGITREKYLVYSGTFKQCWDRLVADYGGDRLCYIANNLHIKIERIN